jgi:integrase/recombinase XerD
MRPELGSPLRGGMEDFLSAMRVEAGLARSTLRAYRGDLEGFLAHFQEHGGEGWEEIDEERVIAYLEARREAGAAERTLARLLVSIRMAVRFLVSEGRLKRDATALLPSPKLRRLLPHALGIEEVEALLQAPPHDGWRGLRDRALLEVLYATGARISEAVGLSIGDLEPRLRVLRLHGKGDKMRLVPLGRGARDALERWLAEGRSQVVRASTRGLASERVFLSRSGRPLGRVDGWRRVKAAALCAGLPSDVKPHALRHSFASHMLAGGADLRAVQEMLGHASIQTTEIYTHLDAEHVRGLHRLYHPRA